jgi:hypothetical protein
MPAAAGLSQSAPAFCSRGGRVAQWPQGDNALAIYGNSAPALPAIDVVADVLYVGSDGIMTSAGSAAGIDLCLHLVREDYGIDAANTVARRLVVSPHRDGAQAQQVVRPSPRRGKASAWGWCLIICISILPPAIPWRRWPTGGNESSHVFTPFSGGDR